MNSLIKLAFRIGSREHIRSSELILYMVIINYASFPFWSAIYYRSRTHGS